jgi:GxxExxY protein
MNRQDAKAPRQEAGEELDALAHQVVDAAFRVHTQLGPGLLESVYEICLVHELSKRGLGLERQVALPVFYDGVRIEAGFRLDLVVAGELIVELKAVESLLPIHKAQVLTYLKLSRLRLALLINFNVPLIKDGIRRIICSSSPGLAPSRLGGSNQ